jgi:protein-L-isoaspartate(D-aspartate) O-methyltransferase
MFGKKFEPDQARIEMVKTQLSRRGINDVRVLAAMGNIPRHFFVEDKLHYAAYNDKPLPIGAGQTISQPYIVALMSQALQLPATGQTSVLEIGTGSGYQAAVLSQIADNIYSVERISALAEQARVVLDQLNITNVKIKLADGGYGWPEYAPYDGIVVTAAAPDIPAPLIPQLKDGARLIVPVGSPGNQNLLSIQRQGNKVVQYQLAPVAFVPLRGEHGWQPDDV